MSAGGPGAEAAAPLDVVVIGGGPAGLAAALWLARYRLRVRLFDARNPRNAPTWAVHGYLGLEDVPPLELRRIGRAQAERAGAVLHDAEVVEAAGDVDDFRVRLESGETYRARRLLFATGLRDIIPEIPGLLDHYGTSIWHCPDCDGPTALGRKVGVIGWGRQIAAFCMEMLTWTDELTILTHGHEPQLPAASREALRRHSIPVRTEVIERIDGRAGQVESVRYLGGEREAFDVLFFHIAYGPACELPASLGCAADEGGILDVDEDFETGVPGVYAAGDVTHGSKLAIRAAADGTRAAIGIYRSLLPPERRV